MEEGCGHYEVRKEEQSLREFSMRSDSYSRVSPRESKSKEFEACGWQVAGEEISQLLCLKLVEQINRSLSQVFGN